MHRLYLLRFHSPVTQGTFDLYWIAVDPDFQKQGVGSKLLDFLGNESKS